MRALAVCFLLAACSKPPPPVPAAKPPDRVAVEIRRAPEGTQVTDVYGQPLGTAPGIIYVPRGYDPYKMNFRGGGRWEQRTIVPLQDQTLSVPMKSVYDPGAIPPP